MLRNLLVTVAHRKVEVLSVRYAKKLVPKADKKLQAAAESLASRGFLRPNKPYDPPSNVESTVTKICESHGLQEESEFEGLDVKFKVLKACFEETGHGVPNSLLHTVQCVEDLKAFYKTPVDTKTPFDALLRMDLPKNLHVQKEYVRFHPEKDTMFGGKSAFPKSSTIVSGLKTRKKYEGYEAKRSWP